MTTPRRLVIQDARPGAFHLISRCVRRAFLCGDAAEHRRAWLEQGIKTQVQAFSIDVLTFAVMSNHLHIVVKTDPHRTQGWTGREVAERWKANNGHPQITEQFAGANIYDYLRVHCLRVTARIHTGDTDCVAMTPANYTQTCSASI